MILIRHRKVRRGDQDKIGTSTVLLIERLERILTGGADGHYPLAGKILLQIRDDSSLVVRVRVYNGRKKSEHFKYSNDFLGTVHFIF